jgi:hypothetical protein
VADTLSNQLFHPSAAGDVLVVHAKIAVQREPQPEPHEHLGTSAGIERAVTRYQQK